MNEIGKNNKSELIKGILLGLAVPFVGYAFLLLLNEKISALFFKQPLKPQTLLDLKTIAILAICLNLIPFHFLDKRKLAKSMRGVLLATFLLVLVWLYFYGKQSITLS